MGWIGLLVAGAAGYIYFGTDIMSRDLFREHLALIALLPAVWITGLVLLRN